MYINHWGQFQRISQLFGHGLNMACDSLISDPISHSQETPTVPFASTINCFDSEEKSYTSTPVKIIQKWFRLQSHQIWHCVKTQQDCSAGVKGLMWQENHIVTYRICCGTLGCVVLSLLVGWSDSWDMCLGATVWHKL